LLPHQSLKASLPKVLVTGQGFRQPAISHHNERDAISQAPLFIGASTKELPCSSVELFGQRDDLNARVCLKGIQQSYGGLATALFRKSVADFQHNGTGGYHSHTCCLDLIGQMKSSLME
jgi:hypothetical protein